MDPPHWAPAQLPFLAPARGLGSPESAGRQVPVGAAGSRAASRVVDVGHQRVGRGPDHALQVEAGVRERGDGQRPLAAQAGRHPGAGETRHCRTAKPRGVSMTALVGVMRRGKGTGGGDSLMGTADLPLCSWWLWGPGLSRPQFAHLYDGPGPHLVC